MNPTPPAGPLARLRAASDLTGIPRERLEALIASGKLRSVRIKGETFVDIDEAERVAMGGASCQD